MIQQTRDETRWLARIFAIFCFLLSIGALRMLIKRIPEEHLSPQTLLPFIVSVFLFWLGYRLLICTSIWSLFSWIPQTPPLLQYLQSRYLAMNKYLRSGLVGGIIMLILVYPLPLVFHLYKDALFYEFIKRILHIILLPLKYVFDVLNIFQLPKEYSFIPVILMAAYFFVLGFGIGVLISWAKGRFIYSKSPQDLNNGSPGCSETEPGDEES
ncbi:MAG: hypothetical protein ABFR90_02100 [Planctomycetota bacterium]